MSEPVRSAPTGESARRSGVPSAVDPMVGVVINGKFRILDVLATGGMGRVYRAEQSPLGRMVAVKVMLPDIQGDRAQVTSASGTFHSRFLREASALAKIQNAHVVTVFDYGRIESPVTDRERFFMAMEFLEGHTLQERLDRTGALTIPQAVVALRQLALGLRAVHSRAIVHRDLKPSNLMLIPGPDGDDVLKIFDFGVTKVIGENQEATEEGVVIGSPRYMAPEQVGGGTIDARTDIYSFGMIAFATLVGRAPFSGETSIQTMMAHLNSPFPSISALRRDVPPWLEKLVNRCAEKLPEQRFASIDDILDVFRANLGAAATGDGQSGSNPRPSPTQVERSGASPAASAPSPRSRRMVAVALLLLVAVVAAFVVSRRSYSVPAPMQASNPVDPIPTPSAAAPAVSASAAPVEPAPKHRLSISSTPTGAEVLGDGKVLGTTPLVQSLPTDASSLHVEIRDRGFESYVRDLETNHDVEIVAVLRKLASGSTAPRSHAKGSSAPPVAKDTPAPPPAAPSPATTPAPPKPAHPADPFEDRH